MATKLSNKVLVFRMVAGVVAAAIAPLFWYGIVNALGPNFWMPPLLTGALVGATVRFAGGAPRDMRPMIVACVLTILACAVGYIWVDSLLWEPFMWDETIRRMFNDLFGLICIALGTGLAYLITRPSLPS